MESKDNMSKMNPQPLLVSTCRDDKQKKRPPLFPVARLGISFFALASAFLFIFTAALILNGGCPDSCPAPTTTNTNSSSSEVHPSSSFSSSSWSMSKCYKLPGAGPILRGLVWCSPAQVALAAALLLAGDRRRLNAGRALAVATLAATAASHVLFARFAVISYVAMSADTISVLWAVATGSYVLAAALASLVLSGILAVVLLEGDRVQ